MDSQTPPSSGQPSTGEEPSPPRVAHTLTACTRCRQRKTRCDPGLPRCSPCERTNAVCEYWDPAKRCNIKRDYVVWLQHRVNDLEKELDRIENEDVTSDPELMMRNAATVKLQDTSETKFLGPSSGTQLTRLVMQLAKQFTDAKTIKDVVPEAEVRKVQDIIVNEDKPTSKVYPLISSFAAEDLPNKELVNLLYQLYCLKVQPMYPALHEPTLAADIEETLQGTPDPFKNFITRMMIAISLQKMDTHYAGLADSYYLAALKYMEAVVKRMDLKTLQAFALIAEYSLLTPTRTAIYYIVGLAVRLVQALGIHEEASITRGEGGGTADPLEIDMRRRLFWCIFTMEAGLSHALGRPMALAYNREHFDVEFFELCEDTFITRNGILPGARPCLRKWIARHFFKMRLIQLEIRRMLYLNKRPTPKDENDPWFSEILAKMDSWAEGSPENQEGIGMDKKWFIGRYNTMVVFLYRPSPQIPKPSTSAALKCFDASRYMIPMFSEQIRHKTVDVTWIFTQAIFMAINTLLWTLSYERVRKEHPRFEVEQLLQIGLESIALASDRWPGVQSAHTLYVHITRAILTVYDKDGDIPLATNTPSDATSPYGVPDGTSRNASHSPALAPYAKDTPSDQSPPAGYFQVPTARPLEPVASLAQHLSPQTPTTGPLNGSAHSRSSQSPHALTFANPTNAHDQTHHSVQGQVRSPFQPLPDDFGNLATAWTHQQGHIPHGHYRPVQGDGYPYASTTASPFTSPIEPSPTSMPYGQSRSLPPTDHSINSSPPVSAAGPHGVSFQVTQPTMDPSLHQQAFASLDPHYWTQASVNGGDPGAAYGPLGPQYQQQPHGFLHHHQGPLQPPWGLNESQQLELMQNLETAGVGDIETIIAGAERFFNQRPSSAAAG